MACEVHSTVNENRCSSGKTELHLFYTVHLFFSVSCVFFLAVSAAVNLIFRICQEEVLLQFLLDGSDAARILAVNDVDQMMRQLQLFLLDNFTVFDDVHRDVVIDVAKHIQIDFIDRAFYLNDVFSAHLAAARVLDDRHAAVHFIQLQVFIQIHGFAGLDVIEHDAFI